MSDEKKPKGSKDRRSPTIDLDKSAVTELTTTPDASSTPDTMQAETVAAAESPLASDATPAAETAGETASVSAMDDKPAPIDEVTPAAADAAPEPVTPAFVPPPPPSRAGPIAGGAIAGALFGLLGAFGLQNYGPAMGLKPAQVNDPRVAKLETTLAALEQKAVANPGTAEVEQRLKAEIAKADARAAAAEQKAAALEARATDLARQAEAANQKLATVEQRAAGFDQKAAAMLAPLDDRLKSAEARLGDARDQAIATNKRVDLLAQLEPPKVDLRPLITRIDDLERNVSSATARLSLSADANLGIDGRVKTVEGSLKGVETTVKTVETGLKGVTDSVKDLSGQQKAMEAAVSGMKAPRVDQALVLGLAGLARRALDQGEPLGAYLTALTNAGLPEATLKALAPFAQAGAQRLPALADLFAASAAKLPAPKAPEAKPDESIMGKVTSGILSQVEVKPVGTAAAADPSGLATQGRQRILSGNVDGAVDLLKSLPADQQALFKPFVDAVQARAAAAQALRTIETDAVTTAARKG